LEVDWLDVNIAFLHRDLNEIYRTQPVGFKAARQEKLVYKIKKSL